ncbi:MAG: SUMF1/EgtB/PvdO family nonheme iron enzyme [Clostridia bacterium]|nr:SUMF1/EgtB/PvdO family nonheme iron enzyme [Clostridia bacterium]
MANFDLTNLAIKSTCPGNELLYDDKNVPSVMVKIPKMTYAELGLGSSAATHPAFIVNGQEVSAIYISKYQNVIHNGRAYSLPMEDPRTEINFDSARAACEAKGAGWHLMTRAEWAMLALWCKANGTQPRGNNDYGKDASESVYRAIPSMARDDSNRVQRVATGSGPASWSHDGTLSGIFDLNGNVWELVGGMRTVKGELQILANNNAADSDNSQAASSAQWKAIKASDGTLITPDGNGTTTGSIKLDWVSSHAQWDTSITDSAPGSHYCIFEAVTCSANIGNDAKALLQALAMFKYDETANAYNGDYFYFNNAEAERAFFCGGAWGTGAGAGVFYVNGNNTRSIVDTNIGFRSAYVELPTV